MSKILLIEPDLPLARTYSSAFESVGYSVVSVNSAQAAVLAADEERPDVVILELQLVGHSGIEFLYEFRSYSDWQTIPALVHTQVPPGEFNDSWELLRNELGVQMYLYKPQTSLRRLLAEVQELAAVKT